MKFGKRKQHNVWVAPFKQFRLFLWKNDTIVYLALGKLRLRIIKAGE